MSTDVDVDRKGRKTALTLGDEVDAGVVVLTSGNAGFLRVLGVMSWK